jgi:Leucine-rich repeat (LRR) protein
LDDQKIEECRQLILDSADRVKEVNCGFRLLTCVPNMVAQFTQLKSLTLRRCHLFSLPHNFFDGLANLIDLNMAENQLTAFPNMPASSRLERLWLFDNRLTAFDIRLPSLNKLNLSGNQLTVFPDFLNHLLNLRYLNLCKNPILDFPNRSTIFESFPKLYVLGLPTDQDCCFREGP